MNDETSNPEILEAEWDYDQVDALFDDLELGADVQHVQVRSSSGDVGQNKNQPADREVTLREAQELLQRGGVKAIQIRYVFEGQTWCDTLMVSPNTIHIIRTANVV